MYLLHSTLIAAVLLAGSTHSTGGSTSDARAQDPATHPEAYALREAWVGKLHVGPVDAVVQFRIEANGAGETRAFFDSITEKRTGFEATWRIDGQDLAFDVARVGATFRGRLDDARTKAEGRFNQGGRELPITLERRASVYESPFAWETRPQRPRAPYPYSTEEIRFENTRDGLTLAGTLTIPAGEARHPAVVLISGSGPQDRDETLLEHKPFLVLADYLSRRGLAVLRYDDRGTGASSGRFAAATTEDFARDASAVVDGLRRHARIDPARIGLVGHSEGGLIAPMVATMRNDVALIVILAGPGVPGATVVRDQTLTIARAEGESAAGLRLQEAVMNVVLNVVEKAGSDVGLAGEIERAVADLVATLPDDERVLAGQARATFQAQLPSFTSPWFRYFIHHDPAPVLRRVRCPVLALAGSKDVQVPPARNLAEIERALAEGGNTDHDVRELPGLNHMLQACTSGAISEYISIPETLDSTALETIERWIAARFLK